MSYEIVRVKHVFIACWKRPELPDGPLLQHETKQAFDEIKEPLLFVSVAPMSSPPPPDDLRRFMSERVDEMLTYCSEVHIVIEGSGFMQSTKRMAIASMVLISGMRKRLFVHESLEKTRSSLQMADRDAFTTAINIAKERGLVGQAPTSSRE